MYDKFKEYAQLVENKFGRKIQVLRSDNSDEFVNAKLNEFLAAKGIKKENTAPHTPQQNGQAERENRTIVESARSMLHAKALLLFLWAEAVNTAVHVLNRSASSKKTATPYELWVGTKPHLEHLRIFGSQVFAHVPKQFTRKFDARSKPNIFVGYDGDSSNYRVYDPETKKVGVSRDVIFNEKTEKVETIEENKDEDMVVLKRRAAPVEQAEEQVEEPMVIESSDESEYESGNELVEVPVHAEPQPAADRERRVLRNRANIRMPARYANVAEHRVPESYKEAMSNEDVEQWTGAIREEFRAHEDNNTWMLVPRSSSQRIIDSKWVFRVKEDPEKKTRRFKARLCARLYAERGHRVHIDVCTCSAL